MYSRLIIPPRDKSFFLFGPRGTGKTSWVKSTFPDAVYIDLLEAGRFNELLADPQRLGSYIPPKHRGWVVLDEVQRVPDLLNEVHRQIEGRGRRFVLTGSSARKLRRGGSNLLAGRALTLALHPLMAAEVGRDFDLERALSFGMLPAALKETDPQAFLKAYVRTYLEEEVRQEGLTRNLSAFARFLEAASFSQGAVLNVSDVARECRVERKVVENYFSVLEDLMIARRLPVFARRAKRRLVAHAKFYFFDAGVFRSVRPAGPLDLPAEAEGAALETLFLQEIVALNDALGLGYEVSYWRTGDGREVDFVLYGKRGLLAFEVKRGARISADSMRGLRAFVADYSAARCFLVCGASRRTWEPGVEIVPAGEMFRDLRGIMERGDGGTTGKR